MKTICLIFMLWLLNWFIAAGTLNAYLRGRFADLNSSSVYARENFAFSAGWGLFPGAAIAAPFMSGFWVYGWSLKYSPIDEDPHHD